MGGGISGASGLRDVAKSTFWKLDSQFHWTAPNYPTKTESTRAVEGQIECVRNAKRADQYEASSMRADVLHNAIGGVGASK